LLSAAAATLAGGALLIVQSRLLERSGIRRSADHRDRLTAALERVRLARGPRELGAVLARTLADDVDASTASILHPTSCDAFVDSAGAVALSPDAALMSIVRETTRPLDLSDGSLMALLPPADRAWVIAHGIALVAAIKRRDATIAAIVVLGRKRGDAAF